MVKILASGEIVSDDDPRATNRSRSSSARPRPERQQGGVHHGEPQAMPQGAGGISMFGQLNERLLQAGLPRFNAGKYVVEPIVSVGMLIAFLMLGFKGLILGVVLFFVSKWSQGDGEVGEDGAASGPARGGRGGSDAGGRWGGQGHRLGR